MVYMIVDVYFKKNLYENDELTDIIGDTCHDYMTFGEIEFDDEGNPHLLYKVHFNRIESFLFEVLLCSEKIIIEKLK